MAYRGAEKAATPEALASDGQRRRWIYLCQLLLVCPVAVWILLRRSRRDDDVGLMALGVPLLFVTLTLASYYYAMLLVLILWRRADPLSLALLFAVEAMVYALQLFEDREVVIYFYHNLLLAGALAVLCIDRPPIALYQTTDDRQQTTDAIPRER